MYIETVPNRNSRPAILLRQSRREGSKVRKQTLANLTQWPSEKIEALRAALRGDTPLGKLEDSFDIIRSLPHGHVAAVLGVAQRLELPRLIASRKSRDRDLVLAMVAARVLSPSSKLATARALKEESASMSLGETLGVEDTNEDELYLAMDWLLKRQEKIENQLAKRHLSENTLILYDVTSSYFEGRTCPLARRGHNRDGKKGKLQIVFGLLCDIEGRPIAVEVFEGNVGDPKTLASQIKKIRGRFGLKRVVLVGDRGLITEARIREDIKPIEGLDWISALRAPAIKELLKIGLIEQSFFDDKDIGEISSPDYPGQRLVVCRNPFLAQERTRKREELLRATEKELQKIANATKRAKRPLRGKDQIGIRVGKVINRFKVGKHFRADIKEESFRFDRKKEQIEREAALDGFYVIRTTVPEEVLDAHKTVGAYKALSRAERAFRSMKTVDLKVRPIYHNLEDRVRAHVFLCMLAYYVEWHMRQDLAPVLFDDDDKEAAERARSSIVAQAQRSASASKKARSKRTEDGLPVHSFQTLLDDLATICKNRVQPKISGAAPFVQLTTPTRLQQKIFDLLRIPLRL